MPKTSDMIQSKFLKKDDFDSPQVLTIKDCTLEEVGNEGDSRWVLWLKERDKGLVLNVTKIRLLESAYGQDTDDWRGNRVKLSHDPSVMFAGKIVGGIKLQTSTAKAEAKPQEPPPSNDEFDDEIPFNSP